MTPAAVTLTALAVALLVACGNDATAQAQEYCTLSAELDTLEGPPSEEQLSEIESLAPTEISEDVETLVEAVRQQDFDNPDVGDAEDRLIAWEDEHCAESQDDTAPETETAPS